MTNSSVITLTTDFGYKDPFAGIIKGVILSINPSANILDITHGIKPFDITGAAFTIGASYEYFPKGTIHVAVVDPGVGSLRRPVLVEAGGYCFIGPDNGVFSLVYESCGQCRVIHITEERYFLHDRSATFHGRDIFAPVAAWLSKGASASDLGEEIHDYARIEFPAPSRVSVNKIEGEVIYTDHFGNAMTSIRANDIEALLCANPGADPKVILRGRPVPFTGHFSQAQDDGLYALINSAGYLEFYVFRDNASEKYNIKPGDPACIILYSPDQGMHG